MIALTVKQNRQNIPAAICFMKFPFETALLLVVASFYCIKAFPQARILCLPRRPSSERSAQPSIDPNDNGVRRHTNVVVRELMELITAQYAPNDGNWTRTRNYLYHTSGKLSVSQVKNVLKFLEDHFPGDKALQKYVLQTSPRILRKNVRTDLKPTADFLQNLYGPDLFRQAIQRNPDLLLTRGTGYNSDSIDLVEIFLEKEMKLKPSAMSKLKRLSPFIFQSPLSKLLSVMEYLKSLLSQANYSVQEAEQVVGKLIVSHPHIFQLCVETNLQPRIKYLRERLGLENADLASLLQSSSGAILGLSKEHNLAPTIDILAELLDSNDLKKCVIAHPPLLGLSIKNLQSKIAFFDSLNSHGMSRQRREKFSSLSSRILKRAPAVFSLSLHDNIEPTVNFLARIWGLEMEKDETSKSEKKSSSSDSLSALLGEYPSILTLSLEGNIQPTVTFYNRTGYIHLDQNWRRTARSQTLLRGRYIAASLFQRLLPRWHFYVALRSQGLIADGTDLPLHVLVNASDGAFCEHLGVDYQTYFEFKRESVPRLNFSSQFDTWLKTGRRIDI